MAKKMTFEDSIAQLEKIIEDLESGDLPLDAALKKFEEGVRLSIFCSEKLDETEKKVSLLMKNKDGAVEARLFSGNDLDNSTDEDL